tara:strand:- start:669 stop:1445 length:777 start_codon:yes stop_codon:yes gene_type:complete
LKAVILAGGQGTRLAEETHLVPKPMVEIAGKPMIWHIMKIFSKFGINDFIICAGYKGHIIKRYFADFAFLSSDVTFNIPENTIEIHQQNNEDWSVTVVDTGEHTMTGGRLLRIKEYIKEETFMLTYGDGVSDVDILDLISFHEEHKCLATLTAVRPPGRFGIVKFAANNDSCVQSFEEKADTNETWINGGFFVLNMGIFDYIQDGDNTIWEQSPLQDLAKANELCGYQHKGFWQAMDTLRDKKNLETICTRSNKLPWL